MSQEKQEKQERESARGGDRLVDGVRVSGGDRATLEALCKVIESLIDSAQTIHAILQTTQGGPSPLVHKGDPMRNQGGPSSDAGGTQRPETAAAYKTVLLSKSANRPKIRDGEWKRQTNLPLRSTKQPTCFRCGQLGHLAATCRDPVVCFRCGKVNHRAWQCREDLGPKGEQNVVSKTVPKPSLTVADPPLKRGKANFTSALTQDTPSSSSNSAPPLKPLSKPDLKPDLPTSDCSESMAFIKRFNSSPASLTLEAAFKRSLFLANTEGWSRERFLEALRQIAPFPWKVSVYPGGYMLVEGPGWWKQQVLNAGMALIEGKEILAEPWDQEAENGFRLKSTWIKIIGLPLKHWNRAKFERIVDDFGILLEVDRATEEKTSFVAAKLRVGVSAQSDIPPTGKAFFRNDRGDWCWKPVKIVVETPDGGRTSAMKRRRVWIRRSDQSETGDGGDDNGYMKEEGEETGGADEDLLQDEDRRNVRDHGDNKESSAVEQETEPVYTGISNEVPDPEALDHPVVISPVSAQQLVTFQPKEIAEIPPVSAPISPLRPQASDAVTLQEKQLVVYQMREQSLGQKEPKLMHGGTRQSLRQKLLNPAQPILEKATQRQKEKNL